MAASDTDFPESNTSTYTRLKGQWVWIGRAIWSILAVIIIGVFIVAEPIRFRILNTVCNADCTIIQISDTGLENIQETFGLSLLAYAIVINSKEVVVSLIYIFSGLILFWRRPDDWLVICISLTLMLGGQAVTVLNVVESQLIIVLQAVGVSLMGLLGFFFPNGRFAPAWLRFPAILSILLLTVVTIIVGTNHPIFHTLLSLIGIAGLASQVYRYRSVATAVERQQTKWVVIGFGIFVTGLFILVTPAILFQSYLSPLDQPTSTIADFVYRAIFGFVGFAFTCFLPISITFSTLRYRLWDADPIINRGLVYGFMTFGAIAIVFALTYFIQFIFGEQQPFIAILIAAVFCGFTFKPAHRRIQHWVDHNIYGLRFDMNDLESAQRSLPIANPGALTGKQINGYEIESVIGKGGMGEVYKGFGHGQQVAIKTMLPEIAKDQTMHIRFQREAEAGKTLQHPNIAKVFTSATLEDTPCLIMEYVQGVELSKLLKENGTLNLKTAEKVFQDVCSALDFAHQHGFIHRDIKPSNIMIRENGAAVLMDFGITKLHDTTSALTGTGLVGTIDYMAPEQITAAKSIDHRADIYALGVMLFEMLTGEKPFKGGPAQVMFAHLQQPAPDPQEIVPNIPDTLAQVILRALEKNPEDRYSSAGEMATALQA